MVKGDKLRGRMVENRYTLKKLADSIGISSASLVRKINGMTDFTVGESAKVKELLNLSNEDYLDIFFINELEYKSRNQNDFEL